MIAALFVAKRGCYFDLPEVDPWDEGRDARKYLGPHSVVAHPPCSSWSKLAPVNKKRYGHEIGNDDGCFKAALIAVRTFGGVLEHPAGSLAWAEFGLPSPWRRGRWSCRWTADDKPTAEWVCEVSQGAYGHQARKLTWLYFVGPRPPDLDWSNPKPVAAVSYLKNHGCSLPRLSKKAAQATPVAFRDMLIGLARTATTGDIHTNPSRSGSPSGSPGVQKP